MTSLGIGALAKRVGVRIDTVRYYERSGLLAPESRLESGYHRYSEAELTRLRFIRRAQVLGFSLKEIGELLALSKARNVVRVKRAAEVKLADVEERIAALVRMQDALPTLVTPAPVRGGPIDFSVLNALGGADCNEHPSDTFAHGRAQATPA
jgi:MerR family copper efflux transcriptional regulator